MKTANQITQEIISNGAAMTNEELEVQFEFLAGKDGWTDGEIMDAMISPWFPWIKNPAAVALGKLGGSSTSPAKRKTSAENGKKGGRPRKIE